VRWLTPSAFATAFGFGFPSSTNMTVKDGVRVGKRFKCM
jgi:hypothetical protein